MARSVITSALAGIAVFTFATGSARADDPVPALSPAYIVHKLAADGVELRSIKFEKGAYFIDVATGGGHTYRAAVDPKTAEIDPRAFAGQWMAKDPAPAGSMSGSLIVQLVDAAGYPEMVAMDMKNGAWKVKTRDAAGRKAELRVDPVTGDISRHGRKFASN